MLLNRIEYNTMIKDYKDKFGIILEKFNAKTILLKEKIKKIRIKKKVNYSIEDNTNK